MTQRESVITGYVVGFGEGPISLSFNGLPEDHVKKCCGSFLRYQVGLLAVEKGLMLAIREYLLFEPSLPTLSSPPCQT